MAGLQSPQAQGTTVQATKATQLHDMVLMPCGKAPFNLLDGLVVLNSNCVEQQTRLKLSNPFTSTVLIKSMITHIDAPCGTLCCNQR